MSRAALLSKNEPTVKFREVTLSTTDKRKDENDNREYQLWQPFFLSSTLLFGFMATYAALIIALAALYSRTIAQQGLGPANSNLYYVWTYGPTTVFTIIAAFWAQVEYRAKQLAPWNALWSGSAPAEKSVLLDYISPWNVITLFKAIRASNILVCAAITGSLLLRLAIVLSTSLLISDSVLATNHNVPLIATSAFRHDVTSLDNIDSRPFAVAQSLLNGKITFPQGTASRVAYQTFVINDSNSSPDAVLNVTSKVFLANMTCHVLADQAVLYTEDLDPEWYTPLGEVKAEVDGSYLQLSAPYNASGFEAQKMPGPRVNLTVSDTSYTTTLSDITFAFEVGGENGDGVVYTLLVNGTQANSTSSGAGSGDPRVFTLWRLVRNNTLSTTSFNLTATCIVCEPRYSVSLQEISLQENQLLDQSLSMLESVDIPQNGSIDLPSAMDIFTAFYSTSPSGGNEFTNPLPALLGNQNNTLDAHLLANALQTGYYLTSAQIARLYLMETVEEASNGTVTFNQQRLLVHESTFIMIEIICTLLGLMTIAVFTCSRTKVVPRDPGSIGGLATVVARSSSTTNLLHGTGSLPIEGLQHRLGKYVFETVTEGSGGSKSVSIVPTMRDGASIVPRQIETENETSKWWQPFSLTKLGRIFTFLWPLIFVALAEIMYDFSQKHNGIVDTVAGDSARSAWAYIPALAMATVDLLYGMMDFAISVVQPYSSLYFGAAASESTIMSNVLATVTLHGIWQGLRHRQVPLLTVKLSVMASSLLTIAAGGLFSPANSTYYESIILQRSDSFNTTYMSPYFNGTGTSWADRAGESAALISVANVSYPAWTTEKFALAHVKLVEFNATTFISPDQRIHTRIPAAQGVMNCTIMSPDTYNVTMAGYIHGSPPYQLQVEHKNSTACTDLPASFQFASGTPFNFNTYFGGLLENDPPYGVDPSSACDTLIAYYGWFGANGTEPIMTIMTCNPYIQEVELDVTLVGPNLTLDSSLPPQQTAKTPKVIGKGNFLSSYDWLNMLLKIGPIQDDNLQTFYQNVIYGRNGTPAAELLGPNNTQKLMDVSDELYGMVVAQVLNTDTRIPTDNTTSLDFLVNGTLTGPGPVRLVQNNVSTRILQAVLSFLALCTLISFFTMPSRHILPKNPCSIGAVASLLADSSIINDGMIPPGSEWCNDRELKAQGIFHFHRFKLGWWRWGEYKYYGIDVDTGE